VENILLKKGGQLNEFEKEVISCFSMEQLQSIYFWDLHVLELKTMLFLWRLIYLHLCIKHFRPILEISFSEKIVDSFFPTYEYRGYECPAAGKIPKSFAAPEVRTRRTSLKLASVLEGSWHTYSSYTVELCINNMMNQKTSIHVQEIIVEFTAYPHFRCYFKDTAETRFFRNSSRGYF